MFGYCPLASGSKGNSIFLGSRKTKILIDAGLSARALQARLAEIGSSLEEIDAILVTHEHSDHIRGLATIVKKWNIPIFANIETAKAIAAHGVGAAKFKIFSTGERFSYADLEIQPFSIQHDTVDPVAFTIQSDEFKVGFCADIGFVTPSVRHHLQDCNGLYLEANHQPSMVHACSRPHHTKMRILGPSGHLSNEEAAALLNHVWHEGLQVVHLAHLSEECNHPDVAHQIVEQALAEQNRAVSLHIAHQDRVSQPVHFEQLVSVR